MFDWFYDITGYEIMFLDPELVELVILCASLILVLVFAVLAVYFLVEMFKWITGGWKK